MFSVRTLFVLSITLAASASASTVTFDCSKVPNICSNDCYAIQCLGKPTNLHRDSENSSEHRDQNACRSPNRCSGNPDSSNSCDEYPYASSQEGGAGAATRCVPAHENSVQGGTLSSFYTRSSIDDSDPYSVAFTGSNGLEYCDGSCDNSGNELVRRDIFHPLWSRQKVTQYDRRYFLTEDGKEILMFEDRAQKGSLDNMVGQDTYLAHQDRYTKIVRAL